MAESWNERCLDVKTATHQLKTVNVICILTFDLNLESSGVHGYIK